MTALYHLEHRFQISTYQIEEVRSRCTRSESFSFVGGARHRIHTWRGVPGKHCDVLLLDGLYRAQQPEEYRHVTRSPEVGEISRPWLLVCDIGRKAGRYDGAVRWRVTIRDLLPAMRAESDPPKGMLAWEDDDQSRLVVEAIWKGEFWGQCFPRLVYTVDPHTDRRGILLRQAANYFGFLLNSAGDDVRVLADEWVCRPWVASEQDICSLNRSASQALYELARNLGWRKLTLRERERLGLGPESKQWQRTDYVEALRLKVSGDPLGVGQYTRSAARGDALHEVCCPACEQIECECQP